MKHVCPPKSADKYMYTSKINQCIVDTSQVLLGSFWASLFNEGVPLFLKQFGLYFSMYNTLLRCTINRIEWRYCRNVLNCSAEQEKSSCRNCHSWSIFPHMGEIIVGCFMKKYFTLLHDPLEFPLAIGRNHVTWPIWTGQYFFHIAHCGPHAWVSPPCMKRSVILPNDVWKFAGVV